MLLEVTSKELPCGQMSHMPEPEALTMGRGSFQSGAPSFSIESMSSTQHEFQAEVQQLLDIVINSLYTDKEIFIRELVSNASDALEKMRRTQLIEKQIFDEKLDLEINLTTDDKALTLTIADYGIGMTREELIENIGTIAHSGSRKFLQAMSESERKEAGLIGQFGVGFYSAFMVAEEVKVYTHSWREEAEHLCWTSDGKSAYQIETIPGQRRGCKIVIKLRKDCEEFSRDYRVRDILSKYSNFVSFPINLNGERVNKIEAIWLKNKSEVSEEQYNEFYKFTADAFDDPTYRMHFSADAPLLINSLLFVPSENPEKLLGVPMEPGVALYCRKVLIDRHPKGLLPDWLRFVKGVVDCADLPLNISRESMQDSALVQKLNKLISKRFLKMLEDEAASDPEKFSQFHAQFGRFLKEGSVTDYNHKDTLAKLLLFQSSFTEPGRFTNLQGYIDRAKDGQNEIYFLVGNSREWLEASPYLEAFKARGLEVLLLTEPIDEYVVNRLDGFDGKKLISAAKSNLKLEKAAVPEGQKLTAADSASLCKWLKGLLGDRVNEVKVGERLIDSPAIVLADDDSASPHMRQMMKAMNQEVEKAKVALELNPRHPLVRHLSRASSSRPEIAKLIAEQLFDNALMAAGMLEDHGPMIRRVYSIMESTLQE